MPPMRRIVVVGAGLAGHRTTVALREQGYDGELVVVGDEAHVPYDRPPLSKQVLAGTFTADQCLFPSGELDATWRLGVAALRLDPAAHVVRLADGSSLTYDGLVIATGRRARPWPTPLPAGASTLRTLDDAIALRDNVSGDSRVVIVGAGFIGCEVAASLRGLGIASVTVADVAPLPMPVLGPEVGRRAEALHRAQGVDFRLGGGVAAVTGSRVALRSGELLPADRVLVATGSLPNTGWLADAGLRMAAGAVEVDRHCHALTASCGPLDEVVAVGDVAAWAYPEGDGAPASIEHWSNARDMAACAAANLLRPAEEREPLASVPTFWSDQYHVKIKSAGHLRAADSWRVVAEDAEKPSLVVEALRGGSLVGAVVMNANRAIIDYTRALQARLGEPLGV